MPRTAVKVTGPSADRDRSRRKVMRILGYVTMAAAGAVLGVLVVKSLPDARRYVAMRKM
jgi:hypothetical protein